MDYGFWWDIATYGNENWKGFFSPREVAENAYEYLCEWEATISNHDVTPNLDDLMKLLHEDYCNGNVQALDLLTTIVDELQYRDIFVVY